MRVGDLARGSRNRAYLLILLTFQISWVFHYGQIFGWTSTDHEEVGSRLAQTEKSLLTPDNQKEVNSQKKSSDIYNPYLDPRDMNPGIGVPRRGGNRDSSGKISTLAGDPPYSTIEDYVDNPNSDMDSVPDKGDLIDFFALQDTDSTFANITESISDVTFQSKTENSSSSYRNSASFSHETPSGTNRLLVVICMHAGDQEVSSITYNSVGLTQQADYGDSSSTGQQVEIFTLVNPPVGNYTVAVAYAISDSYDAIVAMSYTGVNQTAPIGANNGGYADDGNHASVTVTTTEDDSLIVGGASCHGGDGVPATPDSGITERFDFATGGSTSDDEANWGGENRTTSAGDYNFGTTFTAFSGDNWAIACIELKRHSNYDVDQEVQFTAAAHFLSTEELCIKTGSFGGSEDLNVTVWNGSGWSAIASDLAVSSWNNFTVAVNATTFTVKFGGSTTSSDSTQDYWLIDAVLLHLNGTGTNETYVINDSSNVDSSTDKGSIDVFSNMQDIAQDVATLAEDLEERTMWIFEEDTSTGYSPTSSYTTIEFWSSFTTNSSYSGLASKIGIYVFTAPGNSPEVKLGIYDDDNGFPNNLLAETVTATIPQSVGWLDLDLSQDVSISPSTTYYLAHITNTAPTSQWRYYKAATPFSHYKTFGGWPNLDNPAGSVSTSSQWRYGAYRLGEKASNYRLDLEVQWTDMPYQLPDEELCIYAGSTDAEDLSVDVWNGSGWEELVSDLPANSWNNVSVNRYLNSSTFTIRFVDGTQSSDTNRDDWEIDAVILCIWNPIPTDLTAWSYPNATTVSSVYYHPSQKHNFFIQWEDSLHSEPINATTVEINSSKVMRVTNATLGGHSFEFLPNAIGTNALNMIRITLLRQSYEPLIYTIIFDVQVTPTSWSDFGPINGTTVYYDKATTLWMTWNDTHHNELISGGSLVHNGSGQVSSVQEVNGNYSMVWHLNYTSRLPLPQTWVLNVTLSYYGYENRSLLFEISLQKSPTAGIAKWPTGTTIWLNYTDQYTFWVQWQDSDGSQGSSAPVWINDTDDPFLNDSIVDYRKDDSNPTLGNHTFIFNENGTLLPDLYVIGITFGNATHTDCLYELRFFVDYTPTGLGAYSYANGSTVYVAYNDTLEFFVCWQDLDHNEWLFADGYIERGDLELVSLTPSSGNHSFRFNSRNKAIGSYPYTIVLNKTGSHGYEAFSYYITFVVTENPSKVTDWLSRPSNTTVVTLGNNYDFWLTWTDLNHSTPIAGASVAITGNGSTKIQELTHSGGTYYFRFEADQQAFFEANISLDLAGYSSASHSFNFTVLFLHTKIAESSVLNATTINLQYAEIYLIWIVWNDTDNNALIEDSAPDISDPDHINLAEAPSNGTHTFQFNATHLGLLAVTITFELPGYEAQHFVINFQIASNPTSISGSQYDSDATVYIRYSDNCEFWLLWQDTYHLVFVNDANAAITGSYTTQLAITQSGNHTFRFIAHSVGSFEVSIILEATGYEPTSYRIFFVVENNPTIFSDTSPSPGSVESVPLGSLFDFHVVWQDANHSLPINGGLFICNETNFVVVCSTIGGYYSFTFNCSNLGFFGVNITLEKIGYDSISFLFTVVVIPSPTMIYESSIPYNATVWMYYGDNCVFWTLWRDGTTSAFITDNAPYAFGSGSDYVNLLDVSQVGGNHTFQFAGSAIGIYFVTLTFGLNDPEHASTAIVLWFDVRPRPTTIYAVPDVTFPDSATVETTITAQYKWEDIVSRPISGASVVVYWNRTVTDNASFIEVSAGTYSVSVSTGEISRGFYNLTIWFREYGYINQTVGLYIVIAGLPVEFELIFPEIVVRGEDFVLEAYLYRSQSSGMTLLQTNTIPVVNEAVNFAVTVLLTDGDEVTYQEMVFTGPKGLARFAISRDITKNLKSIRGISAEFAGSGAYMGAISTIPAESLPSVESKPRALPLTDQLWNFSIENIVYIVLSLLTFLTLLTASSYKLRARQRTKKRHQRLVEILQEIRSIRMVIIRHRDGLLLFSQNIFGSDDNLDHAVAGMSSAIGSFLDGIAKSMLEESATQITEFVRMQRRGLHMLQRNGVHTAVIVISEIPVDRFTEGNARSLQLKIEECFAKEFARFMTSAQIPSDQLESMVSKYLYTGLLGPIQLNKAKLELQKKDLSSKERHLLHELQSLKTILHNRVVFLLDSYFSHLQNRGVSLAKSAEFILKGYLSGLFEPLSPEQLSEQQRRMIAGDEDSTGGTGRPKPDILVE